MLIRIVKLNKKKTKLPTKPNCLLDVKELLFKKITNHINIYQSKATAESFKHRSKQLLGFVGFPQKR